MQPETDATTHQERVDTHFQARVGLWRTLYDQDDVFGAIYGLRREIVLEWIDNLALPKGARILEAGCGAGLLALDLARRGYTVVATDVNQGMVEAARREVADAHLDGAVTVRSGDAHSLDFPSDSFDLVVAVGVVPFLHSPVQALREMHRVLRPGGHVLLTSDNRWRLIYFFDPVLSPFTELLRDWIRRLRSGRPGDLPIRYYSWRELQRLMAAAGLETVRSTAIGYGPFTMFERSPLTKRMELALHHRLQGLADRGVGSIQSMAAQHIVLAAPASRG
jgi:SAM-dependent methyltransferase